MRGSRVVVVDVGHPPSSNLRTAWVFDDPLEPPRPLSAEEPGLEAFPSTAPDRVWLVAHDQGPNAGGRVWEVDVFGRVTSPERRFPEDRVPVAATGPGLVREMRGDGYGPGLEVWDPATGEVLRTLATGDAFLLDAAPGVVAWLAGSDGLHLTDPATGRDRVVARPPDAAAFSTLARFSPDGRHLAVDTVDPAAVGGPVPPLERFATDVPFPGQLAVVDVETATVTVVPGSRTVGPEWRRNVAWSPSGDRLFFATAVLDLDAPPRDFRLFSHRLGAPDSAPLDLDLRYGPLLALPAGTG